MKQLFANIGRFFGVPQSCSVFITDSEDCPCYKKIRDVNGKTFVLKDVTSQDSSDKVDKIKYFDNLMVFAHGDKKVLNFFYYEYNKGVERKVFIEENWWSSLSNKKRNIYFHSCHGAEILVKNNVLKKFFSAWVSYNNKVYGFYSSNTKINNIQRRFYEMVRAEVKKKKSPKALKTAIEGAYFSLKGDLEDLSVQDPNNSGLYKDYIVPIVASVGKNISSLYYSTYN